jgi:hypothetical protein
MPPCTDETSMTEWRVNLHGDELDLEELAVLLTSTDQHIRREEGRYFLIADRLNSLEDAHKVREAAEGMLQPLNGLTRLRLHTTTPLSIGNIQRIEDDGTKHYNMLLESGTLSTRGHAVVLKIGEGGTSEPVQQKDPLYSWFCLAGTDETVGRLLSMYGKAVQPWRDLYPIFEIIEADVGGAALVSKGWTTKNQIQRFTRTANHSQAAGEGSRHGVSKTEPPPNPMTPAEGWVFIETLLSQWLEFKQSQQTP